VRGRGVEVAKLNGVARAACRSLAAALLPAAAAQDVRGCLGYSHTKIEGKAKKNGWTKEPGGGDDFHISR